MSALLLDTHAFGWAFASPQRLSNRARAAIEDGANSIHVSAASAWELATAHRLGKWPEIEPLVQGLDGAMEALGARELPIRVDHALRAGSFTWKHGDPFDRMLAAQAMTEHLRLVSGDAVFRDLPGLDLLW